MWTKLELTNYNYNFEFILLTFFSKPFYIFNIIIFLLLFFFNNIVPTFYFLISIPMFNFKF